LIRLRLQRRGRKKRPYYHVVAADQRSPRDGRVIERLGRFDNVSENKQLILDEERVIHWLKVGAQPSDTVRSLLKQEGIMYKMHLIRWGKTDEEIEAAITKWKEERSEAQAKKDVSRKVRQKSLLEAEEKEYQKQLEQKAAEAAKQAKIEKAKAEADAEDEKKAEEAVAETQAEDKVEETQTEETAAAEVKKEEEVAKAEPDPKPQDTPAAEAETVEETPSEVKKPDAEEEIKTDAEEAEKISEAEETVEVKKEEAEVEEPKAEPETDEDEKEEKKEDAKGESEVKVSTDMNANEAIEHIKNSSIEELEGFITESEDRVTVQRAWETKQSE